MRRLLTNKNGGFMKKQILTLLMVLAPLLTFAETVTPAKIAELTAHRIDRLVSLKKIDTSFNTRTESILISTEGLAPVAYKALVSQTKPAEGEPLQLEIYFDAAAKPLSFKVIPGGVTGIDPQWPDKDAVSLLEYSLHEILENAADEQVGPFYAGLTSVTLSEDTMHNMPAAKIQVTSSLTTKKLNIYLMPDGSFMSSEVVP
jgi:hypothetical protein